MRSVKWSNETGNTEEENLQKVVQLNPSVMASRWLAEKVHLSTQTPFQPLWRGTETLICHGKTRNENGLIWEYEVMKKAFIRLRAKTRGRERGSRWSVFHGVKTSWFFTICTKSRKWNLDEIQLRKYDHIIKKGNIIEHTGPCYVVPALIRW